MKRLTVVLMVLILLILPGLASQSSEDYTPGELLEQWYQLGAMLRENGTYPYVELHREDKGYEVAALQTRLKQLNYYDKEIVPSFGSGTEAAMRRFERVNKLKVNGWASIEDQVLLFRSVALPNTGTTLQPQMTAAFTPLVTIAPGSSATPKPPALTPAATIGNAVSITPPTPEPTPTPTPTATLGEPVTAPPVTVTPHISLGPAVTLHFPTAVITANPHVSFSLPSSPIVTAGPFVTAVLPPITPPPFELTKPEIDIPHP